MNILNLFKKETIKKEGEPLTKKDIERIIMREEESSNKYLTQTDSSSQKETPDKFKLLGNMRNQINQNSSNLKEKAKNLKYENE